LPAIFVYSPVNKATGINLAFLPHSSSSKISVAVISRRMTFETLISLSRVISGIPLSSMGGSLNGKPTPAAALRFSS